MACTSCSTKKGCRNNGNCGTAGCGKLGVFDWLSNMQLPLGEQAYPYVEVKFKNDRKEFFHTNSLNLSVGDLVTVQAQTGYDVGVVTLTGELVRVQMRNKNALTADTAPLKVYRKSLDKDISVWQESRNREEALLKDAKRIARQSELQMKICDLEFQGDGSKVIVYYTADNRIDFRQLIKDYAAVFSTRVEMKQIGYRQEAAKVGGIGSCGRELCCSTWLTDFRSVNTSAARYQQLSINPSKLAGQCGKLKCCLNYELDSYLDAMKGFPKADTVLFTDGGKAYCSKVDVFKRLFWFTYPSDNALYPIPLEQLNALLEKQKKKESIPHLKEIISENKSESIKQPSFNLNEDIEDLNRFESNERKSSRASVNSKNRRSRAKRNKEKLNKSNTNN